MGAVTGVSVTLDSYEPGATGVTATVAFTAESGIRRADSIYLLWGSGFDVSGIAQGGLSAYPGYGEYAGYGGGDYRILSGFVANSYFYGSVITGQQVRPILYCTTGLSPFTCTSATVVLAGGAEGSITVRGITNPSAGTYDGVTVTTSLDIVTTISSDIVIAEAGGGGQLWIPSVPSIRRHR